MPDALLEARDAGYSYRGRTEPAVSGLDLSITSGASLGIVGESGSGKTTVGRLLVGTLQATAGQVAVRGRLWKKIGRRDPLRRSIQMVFQDPYASLNPALSAQQTVSEVCRVTAGMPRAHAARRATELLDEVGLSGAVTRRRPATLSGGQCQRIGIARALAASPSVLVADEPTSALDVSVQAHILNLLLDLRERHRLALVVISHDLAVIAHMTEELFVMYRGRVVERGSTATILDRPRHPYTRSLIDSLPDSGRSPALARNVTEGTTGCVFAERCPRLERDCTLRHPPLERGDRHDVACWHPLDTRELSPEQTGVTG